MEYHSYGDGRIENFASFKASGVHRGHQVKTDCIDVFLNYKKMGSFKDKQSAKTLIVDLISKCPKQCKRDFEEWSWEIISSLE